MMTKKCFACICTAKENMREIQRLASNPLGMARIKSIADKFMADFGDVDPSWEPGSARTSKASRPAAAASAKPAPAAQAAPKAPPKPSPVISAAKADPNYKTPMF